MKWKKPEYGERRSVIRFAFLPQEVRDTTNNQKYTVWLERYISIEKYILIIFNRIE